MAGTNRPSDENDSHHTALAFHGAILAARDNLSEQSGLETVDLLARVTESRYTDDRVGAEVKHGVGWEREQVKTARCHVLTQLTRFNMVPRRRHLVEKFGMDEVHLPKVGLGRVAGHPRAMLNGRASMSIPLDAPSGEQNNLVDNILAEPMERVTADGYDGRRLVLRGHRTILVHIARTM